MKNKIEKMTGATITARREGNSLLVYIQGEAGTVLRATTLLYNYGSFESFPEHVDADTTSMMYRTPVRTAAKGLIALVLNEIAQGEEITREECKKAVFGAARNIQNWLRSFASVPA